MDLVLHPIRAHIPWPLPQNKKERILEIIAKKEKSLYANNIFCIVIFSIFIIVSVIIGILILGSQARLYLEREIDFGTLIISSILILIVILIFMIGLIVSVVGQIRYCKTPKKIISYLDGALICPDGTFASHEITQVNYKCAKRRYGIMLPWGELFLFVNGQKHVYRYVANIKRVYRKLNTLLLGNSNQQDIIEKQKENTQI